MNPIFLAILAALSYGIWTVFHKIASTNIDKFLGSMILQIAAFSTAAVLVLYMKFTKHSFQITPKGVLLVILAGIAASFIDLLALAAYSKGLSISVGGPLIIGGAVAIAAIFGFAFGDAITPPKLFAIALIVAGASILAKFS